jgi:hypothetical protein
MPVDADPVSLMEILTDKVRRRSPRGDAEEVGLLFILADRDLERRNRDPALRLFLFGIGSKPTVDDYFVKCHYFYTFLSF